MCPYPSNKDTKIENSVKREIDESGKIKNASDGFTFLQNFDDKKNCVLIGPIDL